MIRSFRWSYLIPILLVTLAAGSRVSAQSFFHKETDYNNTVWGYPELLACSTAVAPCTTAVTHDTWTTLDPNASGNYTADLKLKELRTTVRFYVDHDDPRVYRPYVYRVLYKIRGYTQPGDPSQHTPDIIDTLTIGYSPDSTLAYQDQHARVYYGFYKADLEVLEIYDYSCVFADPLHPNPACSSCGATPVPEPILNPNTGSTCPTPNISVANMAQNWKLELRITAQKFDKQLVDGSQHVNAYGTSIPINIANDAPSTATNYLSVAWNIVPLTALPFPALYELEWTYVDDYRVSFATNTTVVNAPSVTTADAADLWYNFKDNSTRVITDQPSYKIPLIYKRGYIVYRVRVLRPDELSYKHTVYSDWTIAADQGQLKPPLVVNHHFARIADFGVHLSDRFNWNFQSSFAEEGKSKQVVSYFDGLLKNRQTITRLNSLPDQQIVAETYYNFEGKPSVQTLPIPLVQTPLSFAGGFAASSATGQPYAAADFDAKYPVLTSSQPVELDPLSAGSPAAKYYSAANPFYATGLSAWQYLKYVPDAQGYPVIQTVYASEDGRVVSQGGAGQELQPGRGHDTRFFYMPPTQNELNRYFGRNIGKAPFYEKTLTKDPNKQLSFYIKDNQGKVMVSGLMGDPAASPLPSAPLLLPDGAPSGPQSVTKSDLLYGTEPFWSGTTRKCTSPFYMELPGTALVSHQLSLPSFVPCTGTSLNIKLSYWISLSDEHGVPVAFSSGLPLAGSPAGTYGAATVNTAAAAQISNALAVSSLAEGKKMLNYEVSYNPGEVEQSVYALLHPVPPDPQPLGWVSPYPSCLKTADDFLQDQLDNIDLDCGTGIGLQTQCVEYEALLRSELYPMAKYGKYKEEDGMIIGQNCGLFMIVNWVTSDNAFYFASDNLPVHVLSQTPADGYTVPGGASPGAQFKPFYRYQFYLDLMIANPANAPLLSQLTELRKKDVKDFINEFDDATAGIFRICHPEICNRERLYCDNSDYEQRLSAIGSYEQAQEAGKTTLAVIAGLDPFNAELGGTTGAPSMQLLQVRIYNKDAAVNGWEEDYIDKTAYVNTVCGDDPQCRIDAFSLNFGTLVDALPPAKKNEYYLEMLRLYIANRQTRISKYKRSSCDHPPTIYTLTLVEPRIFKEIYPNPGADYPTDTLGTAGKVEANYIFSTSHTMDAAETHAGNSSLNPGEDHLEYATQIAEMMSNCRNAAGTFNKTTLKNALKAYMDQTTVDEREWKGGLTPAVLKQLLQDNGYRLDDLCNPYLVDYLKSNKIFAHQCLDQGFFDDFMAFLNSKRTPIRTALFLAAAASSNTYSYVMSCNTTGGAFEEQLVSQLFPNASPGSTVTVPFMIRTYHNTNNDIKSIAIYFHDGSTPFNESKSVAIDLTTLYPSTITDLWEKLTVTATNPDPGCCHDQTQWLADHNPNDAITVLPVYPSQQDLDIQFSSIVCDQSTSPAGDYVRFIGDLEYPALAQYQCSGPSGENGVPFTCPGYSYPSGFVQDFATNKWFKGSIKGLQLYPGLDEQERCISSLEMKKAFEQFRQEVMDLPQYDAQSQHTGGGYAIKGYGHPFFEDAVRSFFNFYFKKSHSSQKYLDFMESCNLTDQYNIPRYPGYLYASTGTGSVAVNLASTDLVYNYFNNTGSGKYSNFNHLYYYRSSGSTTLSSHIYVDFRTFEKNKLRDIIKGLDDYIANHPSSGVPNLQYNKLGNELTGNNWTFADILVHKDNGSSAWTPSLTGGIDLSTYLSLSSEDVTIREGSLALPATKFHFDAVANVVGGVSFYPTGHDLANRVYQFETKFFSDPSRNYIALESFVTHLNGDNTDSRKLSYLDYAYDQEADFFPGGSTQALGPVQRKALIGRLKAPELKAQILTPAYGVSYSGYPYVSYYNVDKAAESGDLFLQTSSSNPGLSTLTAVMDFVKANNGNVCFPSGSLSPGVLSGEEVSVKRLPDNVYWYHLKNVTTKTHRNFYLRLPAYIATSSLSLYTVQAGSCAPVITAEHVRRFKLVVKKTGGADLTVYGKTDFDLQPAPNNVAVFENVMLCDDHYAYDTIASCYESQLAAAYSNTKLLYDHYIDSIDKEFVTQFNDHIRTRISDQLELEVPQAKYQLTLYGYDRAGNLMYTVPPEGVNTIENTYTNSGLGLNAVNLMAKVNEYRDNPAGFVLPTPQNTALLGAITPAHAKVTSYYYNSLNLPVSQTTPDAGVTDFFYDKAGRLVLSRNAKQAAVNKYSYTLYDRQNRIVETGQVLGSTTFVNYVNDLRDMLYQYSYDDIQAAICARQREDVIHTFYDEELLNLETKPGMGRQENLRSRVATVASYQSLSLNIAAGTNYNIALHYSYDLGGNVKTLVYDMPVLDDIKQRYKRVDYDYDLYSGKVRLVSYNRSFADQFYQRYAYDDDNRITQVETSKDGVLWDRDAAYKYYPHGPLARISLGELRVQGIDFAYTLQGWLKSINGDTPDPLKDMGGDGLSQAPFNNAYQKDLLQAALYYFKNDYKPIDPTSQAGGSTSLLSVPDLDQNGAVQSLYNGNIPAALVRPGYFPALYTNYRYDQLNRIRSADYLLPDYSATAPADVLKPFSASPFSGTALGTAAANDIYRSEYHYDRDGNLTTLKRNGFLAPTVSGVKNLYDYTGGKVYEMDNLGYNYQFANTVFRNNKLFNYTDAADHTSYNTGFDNDVQHYTGTSQAPAATTSRLEYDQIGNLVKDVTDPNHHLNNIRWNLYGKVSHVDMDADQYLDFGYDPMNNRFSKSFHDYNKHERVNEYYIRDASGNILAVYRQLLGYHVVSPWLEVGGHLKAASTLGADMMMADPEGSFSYALQEQVREQDPTFASAQVAGRTAGYFLERSSDIREGLLRATPGLVADLLTVDSTLILAPLTTRLYDDFISPLIAEGNDSLRQVFIGELVAPADTATISALLTAIAYSGDLRDHAHFIGAFNTYLRAHEQSEVIGVLAGGLSGAALQYAVNRLLRDTLYRNTQHSHYTYGTVGGFALYRRVVYADLTGLAGYYDQHRTDGLDLLDSVSDEQTRLAVVYNDSPAVFIDALKAEPAAGDILGVALEQGQSQTPLSFLAKLAAVNTTEPAYQVTLSEILDYNRFSLAEHHIYGSSRLGLKTYWASQYELKWDATLTLAQNQALLDASQLSYRRPWYSHAYNSLIGQNSLTPWGNGNTMPLYAENIIGQKRYELTNHLGNVMAVVTDKLTEVPALNVALPTLAIKRASLFAAYDYYPFGMLMPERYQEDATDQCTPITRSYIVRTHVPVMQIALDDPAQLGLFLHPAHTEVSINTGDAEKPGSVDVSNNTTEEGAEVYLSFSANVVAGKEVVLVSQVTNGNDEPVLVELLQQDASTGDWVQLAKVDVSYEQNITLSGTAINGSPLKLQFKSTAGAERAFRVGHTEFLTIDVVQGSYVYMDCNHDALDRKDYRFGFNGQEKDNEVSGIGNHNTAMFWEYDTRLGRRWNLDPIKKDYESGYATFGNNPIFFIDVTGADTINVHSKTLDANGLKEGDKGFDRTNMLRLFTVYTPETTGPDGTEQTYSMSSNQFIKKYAIGGADATGYVDGNETSRIPANVIDINFSKHFFKAIEKTSIYALDCVRRDAVETVKSSWLLLDWDKLCYFGNGKDYDVKVQLLGRKPYAYLPGVGLMESDYLGNVVYGSVMSNFQNLSSTLHDGDFFQDTGIDDVFDSHALIVGQKFGAVRISLATFQSIKNISLIKSTFNNGKFYHKYSFDLFNGKKWTNNEINVDN